MVKIDVKGLDEFREKIDSLEGDFKNTLKKGVMKGARQVAKTANANAKARGFTMDKYFYTSEAKSTRKSDTAIIAKVGTKAASGIAPQKNKIAYYKSKGDTYYIKFPEFGTIKQAPQPTLQPALESNKDYVNKCITDALDEDIKKRGLNK